MVVLILAGHNFNAPFDDRCETLNRQIQFWLQRKAEISVVLSGNDADEMLRACRTLPQCDLVFDTHGEDANIFTNLQSGLCSVNSDCFIVLPETTVDFEALRDWSIQAWPQREQADIFIHTQPMPLWIPRKSHEKLIKMRGVRDINDPQLKALDMGQQASSERALQQSS